MPLGLRGTVVPASEALVCNRLSLATSLSKPGWPQIALGKIEGLSTTFSRPIPAIYHMIVDSVY